MIHPLPMLRHAIAALNFWMLNLAVCACALVVSVLVGAAAADQPPVKGLREVPHDRVQLSGGFWGARQKTHHEVTIPHALDCLEADGHVTNFDLAAGKFQVGGGEVQQDHVIPAAGQLARVAPDALAVHESGAIVDPDAHAGEGTRGDLEGPSISCFPRSRS